MMTAVKRFIVHVAAALALPSAVPRVSLQNSPSRVSLGEVTDIEQVVKALEYRGFQIRVRIEPCGAWLTVTTDLIGFEFAPVGGAGATQLISGSITPLAAKRAATAAAMAWIDIVLADDVAQPP
jgi:hypothetical protein